MNSYSSRLIPYIVCGLIGFMCIIPWTLQAREMRDKRQAFFSSDPSARQEAKYIKITTFPVKATKKQIQLSEVGYNYMCYEYCHSTYEAADIGAPEGAEVVAAVAGEIVGVQQAGVAQGKSSGGSVRVRGVDGLWYYYTHLRANAVAVRQGQVVRAGELLGFIGPSEDSQGAAPHLHFDVSTIENGFDRGVNLCSEQCRKLVTPQPLLISSYQDLAEE